MFSFASKSSRSCLIVSLLLAAGCGSGDGGGTGGTGGGAGGRGGTVGSGGRGGTTGTAGTSGGGTTGAAGTGGGTAGASGRTGTGGTGGGTAACNSLVDDTPGIPEMQVTGTPPTMTGGTIPDGTYVLSERLDYLGSCNCITHNKIVISGTSLQSITRTEPEAARTLSGTLSTSANMITMNFTCPTTATSMRQYSVLTAGGLTALRLLDTTQMQLETWTMGTCHNATNGAANIAVTRIAQALPAATGGTISDGTYFLTGREVFTGVGGATGPTGEMRRHTIVISNTASGTATVQMALSRDGGADQRQTFNATPSGTSLGITITCPPPGASGSFMYSASGNNLYIIDSNRVDTFVRQ